MKDEDLQDLIKKIELMGGQEIDAFENLLSLSMLEVLQQRFLFDTVEKRKAILAAAPTATIEYSETTLD